MKPIAGPALCYYEAVYKIVSARLVGNVENGLELNLYRDILL